MKKAISYIIVGVISFAIGGATGWLARKKTTEVAFEEISEEEQANQIVADDQIKRPIDIQEAINRVFDRPEEGQTIDDGAESSELNKLDTNKIQFMNQWKADKYDTRTKEVPKNVVTTDEVGDYDGDLEAGIDHEFLDEAKKDLPINAAGVDIEEATMEDWDHWIGIPDGDYDCVEIWWFDKDNVLTNEKGQPIENPIGFDVEEKFSEYDPELSGDPDIRVIYNHKENVIFQIVRKHASYHQKTAMEEYGEDDDENELEWIRSRNK